jgi:hypothetical protein
MNGHAAKPQKLLLLLPRETRRGEHCALDDSRRNRLETANRISRPSPSIKAAPIVSKVQAQPAPTDSDCAILSVPRRNGTDSASALHVRSKQHQQQLDRGPLQQPRYI